MVTSDPFPYKREDVELALHMANLPATKVKRFLAELGTSIPFVSEHLEELAREEYAQQQ